MEKVRFYTDKIQWLCFRHAMLKAQKGEYVYTEVGEFNSEYHLGTVHCELCEKEKRGKR